MNKTTIPVFKVLTHIVPEFEPSIDILEAQKKLYHYLDTSNVVWVVGIVGE